MNNAISACFTGRRPKDLCGWKPEPYQDFLIELKDILKTIVQEKNINEFISGGAQGFDQLAYHSVNFLKKEMNVKNTVYIPFRGQSSKWAAYGTFSQAEYNQMLRSADEVHYIVNENLTEYKDICAALYQRNHDMVDNSAIVIALYPDDKWRNPKVPGGTGECMRYAKNKANKPILQIIYDTGNKQHLHIISTKWV